MKINSSESLRDLSHFLRVWFELGIQFEVIKMHDPGYSLQKV